jgi:hypothetical protein
MDHATVMILLVILGAFAFYGFRLARGEGRTEESEFDAGSAIMDFARAFPGEAIRSLHMTTDNDAVFVRLHDNRSGFMRNMGNHYACLLLDAKTLRVEPLSSGDGLLVFFDEWPKFNGEYRFKTREEAADVALWLLASLQMQAGEERSVDEGDAPIDVNESEFAVQKSEDPLADFTSGPLKDKS